MSAQDLSCDAMLNTTKVELDFISEAGMYLCFEKGMRGRVFYISKRYSKANNKYLKSYNPKQNSKHIMILDTNNLYGYVMSKFLPTGGFQWIDPKEFDSNKYSSHSWKGCILEVEVEYFKELCELYNDYPLAADKIEIKREILSIYQYKVPDFKTIPIGNVKKLVPNFFDKEKYLHHYENLWLYIRLRLKLKNTWCIKIQSSVMAKTIYRI